MNRSSLAKLIGAGVISLGLAITPLALPAAAQNTSESNQPAFDTTPLQESEDDSNNLGWLGLIGLIGLAKLFQKRREPVHHRDTAYTNPNSTTSTNYTDPNTVSGSDPTNSPGYTTGPDVEVRDYRDNQ